MRAVKSRHSLSPRVEQLNDGDISILTAVDVVSALAMTVAGGEFSSSDLSCTSLEVVPLASDRWTIL
jgi:hypothetical protein